MSSFKFEKQTKVTSRAMLKTIGISLLALAATASLSGCNFKPLYGTTSSGVQLTAELKSVSISPIPGRVGQRIRNELIYQVTNGGAPLPPLYKLEIAIREADQGTLVTTTGDSQGQIYSLSAKFKLVRLRDNKPMFVGSSHARAAYDKSFIVQGQQVNSALGGVRARIDAENRASKTLAEEIKTRIAAHLATANS